MVTQGYIEPSGAVCDGAPEQLSQPSYEDQAAFEADKRAVYK